MKTLNATPETTNFINCGCVSLKGLELDSFALNIANLLSAVRTFHLLDCARSKELGIEVMEFIHEYALSAASPAQQKQSFPESWLVNLRTQREACGLTTAELARLLDLDEEIIIQWESGEYEPTISMLTPLANVLGCDPLSLLSEKNSESVIRVNAPEVHVENIGARIKSARKKLGLTEADLARMIHTYSDPINDWECGTCEVPADQIVPLASALNCDLMWLLTGKSEAKE
ncbi:helix-turn-helix domain-containing protein [Escherichia coli]|uniref:helix-turn-helix domain-containing protein n=1 Tax=Escherichia coli TaxID=562 RepID=UPI0001B5B03D|nr:helix-turn-helix domain-containing protein [Escherichia coli]EEV1102845.1 helix-turn-helix domain-containing protein [Escherichia coli O26:H11]EFA7774105.1 helix-turn-helix domain-containing protein [Escherichia coli O157:H7]EFW0011002.1 helix-turn-helix domain-containing protein [Shigella sonnei]EFW3274495.1 helix-turn-helix domain-containing protein [Shigella flexneri]EKF3475570.1 helix-turn-helix domain-containing protein [Escherichia coli O45]HDR9931117.1 helix-turn-helix domain-contai